MCDRVLANSIDPRRRFKSAFFDLHQKLAPRTVKHIHRILHRAFGHATKWGAIKRNVVTLVDAPKVPLTEAAALQLTEIPKLLTGLRGRALYCITVVALGTGLRRGEAVALRWQDVDLDGGILRVERSSRANPPRWPALQAA